MIGNNLPGNRQFFRNQLLILKYCGLWNPFEAQNCLSYNRNASKKYTIVAILLLMIFFYIYLVTESLYLVRPTGEKDFSKAFFFTATGYKSLFKVYYFLRRRKEYRALVNEFQHSMVLAPRSSEEEKFFMNALSLSKKFLITFFIFGYVAGFFWGIIPFFKYLDGSPWILPFAAWIPYADTYLPTFLTAYIYQMIGALFIGNMTIALCSFEFTCYCYMNACIQTLSSRLSNIGKITVDSVSRSRPPNRRSKAFDDIVHSVKHHLLVKRYTQHCEELTQASIFAEIAFSSLIICMTTYKMVTQDDTKIEFISTVSYLVAMIFQIYQFCFVGNEITYSSNQLGTSAFSSEFRKFDKQTSRVFLILHKHLQQEINVSTGGPFKIKLNIDTFVSVMRKSYSFLTVLKAVDT